MTFSRMYDMMGTDKGKRQAKEYGMELTHFDENGKAVMVDVTEKQDSVREATAAGKILVNRQVYEAIQAGAVGKGDVLGGAGRVCHLLPLYGESDREDRCGDGSADRCKRGASYRV